jgi:hypothetical protein
MHTLEFKKRPSDNVWISEIEFNGKRIVAEISYDYTGYHAICYRCEVQRTFKTYKDAERALNYAVLEFVKFQTNLQRELYRFG